MADATCRYGIAQPEQARPGGGSGVVVVPTLAVIKVKYLTPRRWWPDPASLAEKFVTRAVEKPLVPAAPIDRPE